MTGGPSPWKRREQLTVLTQIRACEPKGKLAIVNPQRRMGCAALMPEYSFTLEHRQGVEIGAAGTNAIQGFFVVSQGGTPQDDSGGRSRDRWITMHKPGFRSR
jgi:hypothetical protein